MSAIRTVGNQSAVSVRLIHGALRYNVLAQNKEGQTPLHTASSISNEDSLRFIASHQEQCKRTFAMEVKNSPLHLACTSNGESAVSIVAQLLEWDANIDCVDEEGKTPLRVACEMSTRVSFVIAIELCAREAYMESVDENGNTPLLLDCQSRGEAKLDTIQHLINQGASPLKINNAGEHPMVLMFKEGAYDVPRLMMDSVIRKTCKSKETHSLYDVEDVLTLQIDWNQVYGNTNHMLLRVCGEHGMNTSAVVGFILRSDFDVDVTNFDGKTAAHAACGDVGPHTVSVLKVLQENGCSMTILDSHGRTALHEAVDSDDNAVDSDDNAVEEVLDLLFDSGLDVNSVDADGNTPLHVACGSRKVNVRKSIHWLLNHEADFDLENHDGDTCYDVASKLDSPFVKEMLMNEILLKYFRFPNDVNKDVVKTYLEKGADINCTDLNGNTIIHRLVPKAGETDVRENIKFVKSLGGDLRIKNRAEKTAYEIALHCDAEECILQLLHCDDIRNESSMSATASSAPKENTSIKELIIDGVLTGIVTVVDKVVDAFD